MIAKFVFFVTFDFANFADGAGTELTAGSFAGCALLDVDVTVELLHFFCSSAGCNFGTTPPAAMVTCFRSCKHNNRISVRSVNTPA